LFRRRDLLCERRSGPGPRTLGRHCHVQGGETGRDHHRCRQEEEADGGVVGKGRQPGATMRRDTFKNGAL
jgi:hypothetical protein